MKRAIVLALTGLMVFGVLAFADTKTMPQNCSIPGYWSFTEESTYDFAGSGYQLANKVGWCDATGQWHLKVITNRRLQMSIDFSKAQFSGTAYKIGSVQLPTQFKGYASADRFYTSLRGWVDSYSIGWTGFKDVSDITAGISAAGTLYLDPAHADGYIMARVYRDGYNDPAATYTSTITVNVWVP